jgi:endonuclease III related protein
LKTFLKFLDKHYGGSLTRMFARPTAELREQLLALNGVGHETADSILLYAGQHPIFVVDAYTRRIATRHSLLPETAKYDDLRALFEQALAGSPMFTLPGSQPSAVTTSHSPSPMSLARRTPLAQVFNEIHALTVGAGKRYCLKSNPRCDECPIHHLLPRSI